MFSLVECLQCHNHFFYVFLKISNAILFSVKPLALSQCPFLLMSSYNTPGYNFPFVLLSMSFHRYHNSSKFYVVFIGTYCDVIDRTLTP